MGLERLVPMQPVKSMAASVSFYENPGFVVEDRYDEWGWAMLRCWDCQLMLDQSFNLHAGIPRNFGPLPLSPEPGRAPSPCPRQWARYS